MVTHSHFFFLFISTLLLIVPLASSIYLQLQKPIQNPFSLLFFPRISTFHNHFLLQTNFTFSFLLLHGTHFSLLNLRLFTASIQKLSISVLTKFLFLYKIYLIFKSTLSSFFISIFLLVSLFSLFQQEMALIVKLLVLLFVFLFLQSLKHGKGND